MSKNMKVGNFAPTKMSVSAITCESLNTALDKLTEIGNEWRDKLNAPLMREIGGRCELRLLRSESITGLFGDEMWKSIRGEEREHGAGHLFLPT